MLKSTAENGRGNFKEDDTVSQIVTLLILHYDQVPEMTAVRTMEQSILAQLSGMLGRMLFNFARTTSGDIPSVLSPS